MDTRQGLLTSKISKAIASLAEAALDRSPVSGWTHNFYRYPARFSPQFASAAITLFSKPGDTVLDPYMGGGTAIVEGMVAGRYIIGNDVNSLATFITRAKVGALSSNDMKAIKRWGIQVVPKLSYSLANEDVADFIDSEKTRNLSLAKSRFIKKAIAAALASIDELPTNQAKRFAKCIVLRVSQWALDGKERHTPLASFRRRLADATIEMLSANLEFSKKVQQSGGCSSLLHRDADQLPEARLFSQLGKRASLVVTSPPYPGVHVLYHRWQVDGRRETPAPYWIAGCNDGQGGAYYNFADRRDSAVDKYFTKSLATLKAIRQVMRKRGYMIQMVAFNRPTEQLPRYLENMREAGFEEIVIAKGNRIWRQVPGRKWHARQKGETNSAKEVVLVHQAV